MTAIFGHQVENQLKEEFFGRATRGFFVDVGANDPFDGSQTWHLEQLGWDGVLVEPQRDLAEQSRQRRRAKVYAVACSSPANAGKTMTLNLAGIQSSLNPDFFVPDMVPAGVTEVPVMTLDQILVDAKAPAPLDLVSIDVETHELAVLSGFDLARWRPRLILIEDIALNLRLHRYLRSRGGAPHRDQRLVRSGRPDVPDQPVRTSAIHSQILSGRAVPRHARDFAAHPASLEAANGEEPIAVAALPLPT